ncbi:MAG: hypothetical protein DBX97_02380 [Collinsella tanakaei]|nr:MAG: hypothetical protein DBX97_02380 [Collinsella tanakaei]
MILSVAIYIHPVFMQKRFVSRMKSILDRHKSYLYSGIADYIVIFKYAFYRSKSLCYNLLQQLYPLTIFTKIFYIFVKLHIICQKNIIILGQSKVYTSKSYSMLSCIFI